MLAEIGAVLHQPFSEMERRRWTDFVRFHDEARRIARVIYSLDLASPPKPEARLPEPTSIANPDGLKFGDVDPVSGLKIARAVRLET